MNFLLSVSIVNKVDVLGPCHSDGEGGKPGRNDSVEKNGIGSFFVHCELEVQPSIFDRDGRGIARE
jgi:hypothetical protein